MARSGGPRQAWEAEPVTPEEALRRQLAPSMAENMRDVIGALGGPAAATREALGYGPRERLPAAGTAERREYNAMIRQAQRYTTTAGQRRGQGTGKVSTAAQERAESRWRQLAGPILARGRRADMRRAGARWTVAGALRVGGSKDPKRSERDLPAVAGSFPIGPTAIGKVLDAAEAGNWTAAAARFFEAVSAAYHVQVAPEDGVESPIESLTLAPNE